MSAYLDILQNLASAFLLGICFYAAFSTVVTLFRGRAGPPLKDRRRTSLLLFLKLAAFWAKITFLNFAMPSNNACQVTIVFSTLFDQAARTAVSAFLIWSVSNGLNTQLKRLFLSAFVGARFVLGAILAGFTRPQFADICVGKSSSLGVPIVLLLVDGLVLTYLVFRIFTLGIWADTRELQSSTSKEQGKGLVALSLGYLLWFAMSTPLTLGSSQIPLFFRTGFPAIGIVVLTVIINYFSGALALQRERQENRPYDKRGPSFDTDSDSAERSSARQYLPGYDFSSHERQKSIFQVEPSENPKELPRSFQGVRENEAHARTTQLNRSSTGTLFLPIEESNGSVRPLQYLPELDFSTLAENDWLSQKRSTTKVKDVPPGVISATTSTYDASALQEGEVTCCALEQAPFAPKRSDPQFQLISSSQEGSNSQEVHQVTRKTIDKQTSQRSKSDAAQISPLVLPCPLTRDSSWLDMRASETFEPSSVARRDNGNRTFYSDAVGRASPMSLEDRPQRPTSTDSAIIAAQTTLKATCSSPQSNSTITRVPSPSRSLKRKQLAGDRVQTSGTSGATKASSSTCVSPGSEIRDNFLSPPSPLSSSKGNSPPRPSSLVSNVAVSEAPVVSKTMRPQTTETPELPTSLATEPAVTSRRRTLVIVEDPGKDESFGDILVGTDTLELLFPAPPSTLVRPLQSTAQAAPLQVTNHVEGIEQCLSKPSATGASKLVQLEACAPITLPDLVVDTGSAVSSRPSSAESAQAVGGSQGPGAAAINSKSSKSGEFAARESQKQPRRPSRRPSVVCVEGKLSSTSGKEARLTSSSTGLLAIHSKHRSSVASMTSERSRERVSLEPAADHAVQESLKNQSNTGDTLREHVTIETQSVTEEVVTVMLDTEEASSIFWDTADDPRCFKIKPLIPSPKIRRKTMPWHYRIGDAPPTFSGRRKQRNSKTAPPPVPLLLGTRKSAPDALGLNKPLPDESEAMRDIQEQLRLFEQPSHDAINIVPEQSDTMEDANKNQATLMKTLDHEIGRQRKYWLALHQNLNQDSSATDEEGSTVVQHRRTTEKPIRPISRYSQIRNSFETQISSKPPVPIKSNRRDSTRDPRVSRGHFSKERSVSQKVPHSWKRTLKGQHTASSAESHQFTSTAVRGPNRCGASCSHAPRYSESGISNGCSGTANAPQSSEILPAKVYKPITELWRPITSSFPDAANRLWTPPNVDNSQANKSYYHDVSIRRHRRVPRLCEEPLTISSTGLWMNKSTNSQLSDGLWGAKPYLPLPEPVTPPKAARKPLRRSRRTTLLPDIVESPKPVPGKEGALGVFQWPWGPSDSAQIQPMYPPPPPLVPIPSMPEFTTTFDANEYEMATEAEDEYSSYFEEYDDEGLSAEDILDETGFWQLYSKVQCQAIPLKADGFTSAVRIVEDYENEQAEDPDAESLYDADVLEHGVGWEQKVSTDALEDNYRFEGVALQHSPMAAA
ncbi:MAG: hypothetical protein M1835_003547 [Candelina submexicana]|nr:MAG: hypothetical protein M1835_003547 [Candelina submexicana]